MTLRTYQTLLLLPWPAQADALHTQLQTQLNARVRLVGSGLDVIFGEFTFELRLHPGGQVPGECGEVARTLGLDAAAQQLSLSGADDPEERGLSGYFALTRALRRCLPSAVFFPGAVPRALQA